MNRKACLPRDQIEALYTGDIEVTRISGDWQCPHCTRIAYDHPAVYEHEWVTIMCDGRLVHL